MRENERIETPNGNSSAETALARLKAIYSGYIRKDESKSTPKGVAGLFSKWFSIGNPNTIEPRHEAFLTSVQSATVEICSSLDAMSSRNDIDKYALEAASLMLSPKPPRYTTAEDAYLIVAENNCLSLLRRMSAQSVKALMQAYKDNNPKRMMYPNQRKLLSEMERIASGN